MTTTIHDILAELRSAATDERDKGDKFERLMAQYFKTDITWTDRFRNVWLWTDWPDRHGKPDTGIDLVAEERESGELTAIQCKFYDPTHTLQKGDIDSFFTASGKQGFSGRLIVSTTDKWSKHAEDALKDQQVPVTRVRVQDLDESSIDWSGFSLVTPEVMELRDRKVLRPHQAEALDDVRTGFGAYDRGKLIMACGTGKTFTSLRLAEERVPPGGTVLFLVPSISLLSQTLNEWTAEAENPLRPFAVCSDTKVGKGSEDISPVDLAYPATTSATKLHHQLSKPVADRITVVFSTYQSLPVVAEAQAMGLPEFDLIVCDEAHRTTGVTLVEDDESNFVKVHDQSFIKAAKRLYMTATPRIYDDSSKAQAQQGSAEIASMDDESKYGPEFHRLGFGEAVTRNLLTDYKVLVLAVDEEAISRTFQAQLADENNELRLDDAAKIVGCWNGLAKRGHVESGFGDDKNPMGRAVAFSRSIKDSEQFARQFTDIIAQYTDSADLDAETDDALLQCEVQHVDGTFNVLRRSERLDWLKGTLDADACRVLTNVRCLSEGVDVPALDAVMFLNPRNSVVDVVQSVGRVMRKAPGKEYGYVILPIGIPSGMTPEQALSDNKKYKVVWQVLQALRAHDERFNAMVNKIELNKAKNDKLQVIGIGGFDDGDSPTDAKPVQGMLAFPNLAEWRDAIYAKIVQKVGDRRYWEDWAKDVQSIAENHTTRIKALLKDPTQDVQDRFDLFLEGLRGNLNESITRDDAIDMLAQHLITRPVFDALFEGYSFADHNPVSLVMQDMLNALDEQNLDAENETLDKFYASVRLRAEGIDNAEGKQQIITELYEKFFKIAFPRASESLGIVYTPVEIVDFIIRSVEAVLREEFDASISDEGVHVLDPFTGTGTFIVRLLQSGLIRPEDLLRKYTHELHANELLLLAYYIAAINIEATFHGIAGGEYGPFNGIVLTDTFQMAEDGDTMDEVMFPQNNQRVAHQKALDIRVIIGNPPYSVGQGSQNDGNENLTYPTLDGSIEATYARRSSAELKRNLYDSYVRAIRWASDRIEASDHGGVIGFVTNGAYIDSKTADGLRKTLTEEFHTVYVYNLRGNQRTAGELSRQEGGKVFGSGSRSTVAILLLVKKPGAVTTCDLQYHDIGDYLTREDKLTIIENSDLDTIPWQAITPNAAGDWINQRNARFATFIAMGKKKGASELTLFETYSLGVVTGRDAWAYNFSGDSLVENMGRTVDFFNMQAMDFDGWLASQGLARTDEAVNDFIDRDATKISWTRGLKALLRKRSALSTDPAKIRQSLYRPFNKEHLYFDRQLNEMVLLIPSLFPSTEHANLGICVTAPGAAAPFSVLATDLTPNLNVFGAGNPGQFFPRYRYSITELKTGTFDELDVPGSAEVVDGVRVVRHDNISDAALSRFQGAVDPGVAKDAIFNYVYGLLHAPQYRREFSSDLSKLLPRIPVPRTPTDFWTFSEAGKRLVDLHTAYESVDPYPLEELTSGDQGRTESPYEVRKMRFGKSGSTPDRSTIVYNSHIVLRGIPPEAHELLIGSRTPLEWVIERYQVKTDKASGIVNDPNDWCDEVDDPRYIIDLVKRIVTVSVETVKIVKSLPALDLDS